MFRDQWYMAAGGRTRTLQTTFPGTLAHCSSYTGKSITKPPAHNATGENNPETRKRKVMSQMCGVDLKSKPFYFLRQPALLSLLKIRLPLPQGIWMALLEKPLHSPFLVGCPFYRWENQDSEILSIFSKVSLLLKCSSQDSNQVLFDSKN